ncbi:hypothetical protein [Flavobacterium yafengii]|uniref:Uncharacterized protein n=1 Tax=Flavobacterium yafengii TaxID=3041253 RepID=A0AAW6TPT1_9FLAO|nr:hypothetical protein [Flavobacterium yafengii]MDI5951081.1 hypothetical protein [Flavobacterium yafengii]
MEKILNSEYVDKEFEEACNKIDKIREDGLRNVLKHFDRIHDKLFVFNNILIAGFFGLSKIDNQISVKLIIIPILNLCFLIFIEYEMMEISRFDATIKEQLFENYKFNKERISRITIFSFLSILSTLIVTLTFLYFLFQ